MAGNSEKLAAARRKNALWTYTTIAILFNLFYFLFRFFLDTTYSLPLTGILDGVGLLLVLLTWYYAVRSIVSAAAAASGAAGSASGGNRLQQQQQSSMDLDCFEPMVLAILIMLLQLYTANTSWYWLLLLLPLKFAYGAYSGFSKLPVNQLMKMMGSNVQSAQTQIAAEKAAQAAADGQKGGKQKVHYKRK